MSENEEKRKKFKAGVKAMRRDFRDAIGLSEVPVRERIIKTIEKRKNPSQQRGFAPNREQAQGEILEGVRNRFKGFLQREPQKPQLSEMEAQILTEHRAEMIEQAEKRQLQQEKELKDAEDATALKRAKEKMSIEV